jgi:hypothetical protein
MQRLFEKLQSRSTTLNLLRSPLALQLLVAASQHNLATESIESEVSYQLLSHALRDADADNAWLAYRALLGHGSQPQVAQAAEALSTFFLGNDDTQSAERVYDLASERFETQPDVDLRASELSDAERQILMRAAITAPVTVRRRARRARRPTAAGGIDGHEQSSGRSAMVCQPDRPRDHLPTLGDHASSPRAG